jgi:uncharacterized protein with ParB-like and HNH nuclease domain
MEAREAKIQPLFDGSKQYLLPLFQRKYVWDKPQWGSLWKDIYQLYEDEELKSHFIGSIVTIPMTSVPQGVAKFVLIDGQQRLTTLFVLLVALRDKAKSQNDKLAEKIHDTLLINRYEENLDFFKLIPTEKNNDRITFINLIKGETDNYDNQIKKAYQFFEKEIKKTNIDISKLLNVITQKLSIVSIILHENDNPHLVFESLNSTGVRLLPSDLMRNYFFMRIHTEKQTEIYNKFWLPMESKLSDIELTEFIRHYLKKDGTIVKESEIYFKLREKVTVENAIIELQTLSKYSHYYSKLLYPSQETNTFIRNYLQRLNVLEVTTVYPFLLNCYHDFEEKKISLESFLEVLKILENYLIRRYIANIPTNQLDKIFPPLYGSVQKFVDKNKVDFLTALKLVLSTKSYPTDFQLHKAIEDSKLYGGGDKIKKTKHLLSLIELSFNHKEMIQFENLTIEHILPQTLNEKWKSHLGENWEQVNDLYVHTLGNLTLTAYNSELNNDDFEEKKKILKESNLELNKYFQDKPSWKEEDIKIRAEYLSNKCLEIWKYFGEQNSIKEVIGTKPTTLIIWGQEYPVKYWVDVLEITVKTITDLAPDKLEVLINEYPRFVGKNKEKFRRPLEVVDGVFIEKNFNSENIQKFCVQAIQTIELTTDDWQVKYS